MPELGREVQAWEDGDDVVLWHGGTGRHVRLSAGSFANLAALPPVQDRLRRGGFLADPPAALHRLIPCRHRAVLSRPDLPALWLPVPAAHTPGGRGWRLRRLTAAELRLWRAINDARTTSEVAEVAAATLDDALAFLRELASYDAQAVQLRDRAPHPRDAGLHHLVGPPRPPSPRTQDQHDADGATDLRRYHGEAIVDGTTHFDERETTVAHALSDPHPALGGRRYGQALFDALTARGWPTHGLVVEVGCGTGAMAEAWLSRSSAPDRYVRLDRSPELLRVQAQVAPTAAVLGDATASPLAPGSVDVLLSNEVLADLPAVPWAPGEGGEVAAWRDRFGLDALPGRCWYNLGAWKLVAHVADALRPGGRAFLSEFGELDAAPEEAVQLDHPEVSIHFGHLAAIAGALGLRAEVVRLDDLLGLEPTARQLSRTSWHALRALARSEGLALPARAWTPDTLSAALPWPVDDLCWVPLSDEGPGPLVTRFQALLLARD